MKHFHEALRDSIATLKNPALLADLEKVCLIVDLEGRFRALVKPSAQADPANVETTIKQALHQVGDVFWKGELWLEDEKPTPSDRALFDAIWTEGANEPDEPKVFVLHRRVSKDSWFEQATEAPWPLLDGKTPPILSFYSYKGGVGRTTALASIAIQMARKGKRVLALDFDLEAPGLASIFPPPGGAVTGIGVVDFLMEFPVSGTNFPVEELSYVYDEPSVVGTTGGEIHIVPAGVVDSDYLETLARVNYRRIAMGDDSSVSHLLKQLRNKIKPDVYLIDSRAGLHDIGGLALSPLVHRHILFGLDSEQSWRGIALAIRHLGADRLVRGLKQQECVLVQSMASPRQEIREASVQRFLEKSYEVFSEGFYDSADQVDGEHPVPDLMAENEPHHPVVLKYSDAIMGYNSVTEAADELCGPDYANLSARILPESTDE